jgi:hypothetical protein
VGGGGRRFFLGNQSAGFSSASSGTPSLRVPFNNVPPGAGFPLGSSSFVLAARGFAAGGQAIGASLQLWGAEGNVLYHLGQRGSFDVSLLGGIRYLDLREGLTIVSTETLTRRARCAGQLCCHRRVLDPQSVLRRPDRRKGAGPDGPLRRRTAR